MTTRISEVLFLLLPRLTGEFVFLSTVSSGVAMATGPTPNCRRQQLHLRVKVQQPHQIESITRKSMILSETINLLHSLGPKACRLEVENTNFDLFSSLPKMGQEIHPALKLSFKSTFELFKKNTIYSHWNPTELLHLRELLNGQTKSHENSMPMMSSELKPLVKNFRQLNHFLSQQNFNMCAWEVVRNEILGVMDHFYKITVYRKRHIK
ncbi:interferon kappa-like [Myxocyprinus asiaticus]|uniref:interferon kappa-like n=1 Tax=Myxocyprinus asiaticus TaxID=70543 RepID=UPI0022217BD2|nr:interferon kappa-like [Myxocyprinus asiaticus]